MEISGVSARNVGIVVFTFVQLPAADESRRPTANIAQYYPSLVHAFYMIVEIDLRTVFCRA